MESSPAGPEKQKSFFKCAAQKHLKAVCSKGLGVFNPRLITTLPNVYGHLVPPDHNYTVGTKTTEIRSKPEGRSVWLKKS